MKPTVLIVDDEPINVRIIAALLEANDYQVRSAFSGEECLRRVAVEPHRPILEGKECLAGRVGNDAVAGC